MIERAGRKDIERQTADLLRGRLLAPLAGVVPDPVAVLNDSLQILYANPAFSRLAGHDPKALLGQRFGEALGCVHHASEGGCGTHECCGKLGVSLAPQGGDDFHESPLQRQDGEAIHLQVWARRFELESKPYLFLFLTDLSDQKRRRLLERIFFHDIMNTAGGLHGFADLLREEVGEKDEGGFAQTIFDLSGAVIDEIQAQRELSAAESNELATHPIEVDALELLQEVAVGYRAHQAAHGKRIVLAPDSADLQLLTDRTILRRVIGNMVKNALEASREGEAATMRCDADSGGVRFSVHNVAEMARNVQRQIFKRTFSTKGHGRGIGSYSIKLLGEKFLQGKVGFESTAEKGTTFWIWLPNCLEKQETPR